MKKIGNYQRDFTLWGGSFVRSVFCILSGLNLLGGVAVAKKEDYQNVASTTGFSWETFILFIISSLVILLVGFVVGKLLDIQNAKLELLEMQTEAMLNKEPGEKQ